MGLSGWAQSRTQAAQIMTPSARAGNSRADANVAFRIWRGSSGGARRKFPTIARCDSTGGGQALNCMIRSPSRDAWRRTGQRSASRAWRTRAHSARN
jgi:hypothetical protein